MIPVFSSCGHPALCYSTEVSGEYVKSWISEYDEIVLSFRDNRKGIGALICTHGHACCFLESPLIVLLTNGRSHSCQWFVVVWVMDRQHPADIYTSRPSFWCRVTQLLSLLDLHTVQKTAPTSAAVNPYVSSRKLETRCWASRAGR